MPTSRIIEFATKMFNKYGEATIPKGQMIRTISMYFDVHSNQAITSKIDYLIRLGAIQSVVSGYKFVSSVMEKIKVGL